MANLLKYTGGVLTQGNLPETWTAPTSLFGTQDREDTGAGTFASATSRWTAPSSDLPDGYLFIGAFEYQDTSNGRFNPQARFEQITGTGNFVSGYAGGYNRDASEDRSYVRTWAFYDGPSASATVDFQWKADTDDATGGTERSELQVIPFYYSDIGLYTSTSNALYGGTTPNQVTGFTGTDGTNITLSGDVVSVTGDNTRYLVLGAQFFEGRGNTRTQRWHGLEIDGVQEDAAKAYSYYRNTANDESGDIFTWLIETVTDTVTIEQNCYRGDGVGNLQGGADVDGTAPSVGEHALVVIELNDSAEVFRSRDTNQSALLATTGPVDLDVNETTDFNDTASFTDVGVGSINCVQTADHLFGANVSVASNLVANTTRWTAYSEFTINGTENADSVAGDYMRNDQSTTSTFGWSANLLGFEALTAGDDVGVSVTELAGSEGGGAGVSPAGWTGFWGINLDTLQAAGGDETAALTGTAATSAVGSVSGARALLLTGLAATAAVGSVGSNVTVALTGVESTSAVGSVGVQKSGSVALTGVQATTQTGGVGFTESGTVGLTGVQSTGQVGSVTASAGASVPLTGVESTGEVGSVGVSWSVDITGVQADGEVGSITASVPTGKSYTSTFTRLALYGGARPLYGSFAGKQAAVGANLSGVEATTGVGDVSPSTTVGLTGVESTGAVGSVSVSIGANIALTGVEAATALGTLDPSTTIALTGVEASSETGSISAGVPTGKSYTQTFTRLALYGGARPLYGSFAGKSVTLGANLTGVEITTDIGDVTPSTTVSLTGVEASTAVGSVDVSQGVVVALTGVESTGEVGSVGFTKSGTVQLTGVQAVCQVGNVGVDGVELVPDRPKGGISKKRRRRYLIEIDGQFFDADSVVAAQLLLEQAEELAKQSAQSDIINGPEKVRIKPPRIKVTTPSGEKTKSVILTRDVAKTQRKINKIYLDAHKEVQQIREIAGLMHKKIEKEAEEEAILMLIL